MLKSYKDYSIDIIVKKSFFLILSHLKTSLCKIIDALLVSFEMNIKLLSSPYFYIQLYTLR